MTTTDRKKRRSPEMRTPFRLEFTGSPTQPTDRPVSDELAAGIAERSWDYAVVPGRGLVGTRDIDALLADRKWQADQIGQLQQERDEERERCAKIVEQAASAWGMFNATDLQRLAAEIRAGKGE